MTVDTLPVEYLDNYHPLLLPHQELLLRSPHLPHLPHPPLMTSTNSRKGPRVTFQDTSSPPLKSPLCSRHQERQPSGEESNICSAELYNLVDISLQQN